MASEIPEKMTALWYHEPRNFEIRKDVPVPKPNDDQVLIKVNACGVCGTDQHIHEGEFISKFPLIPGHEFVGPVVAVGKNVKSVKVGQRVVCDVGITCKQCDYCRRGEELFCENFTPLGVAKDGGFADYVVADGNKVFPFHNMTDIEATLTEPASCAVHGLDKLGCPVGAEILMIGSGPTGLILAQLLKLNGALKITLAANKGVKMDVAKKIGAADVYIELDRENPKAQWEQLKKDNPHGFDVVVEATGVESIVNDAINYVRRGGTLLVYGVYADAARVSWSPTKIFLDEIRIIGSFSQTYCFPRAVAYLDSGKVNVKEMVTATFGIEEYGDALAMMASRKALKLAILPAGSDAKK